MDFSSMAVKDIAQLPGLSDLPMAVKGRFAQALKAESEGRHADAAGLLLKAIDAESAHNAR